LGRGLDFLQHGSHRTLAAQQMTKMPRVGILSLGSGDKSDASFGTLNAFVLALKELGYIEGQNVTFEWKFADGDAGKLSRLAQELVDSRVDAIVALATPSARAAKRATTTIPIVAIGMGEPVDDELVSSLARPGGNVTGTAFLGPDLVSRRLQLFKELVPQLCPLLPVQINAPHADLFDHLVGGGEQRGRDRQIQCLRSIEVNDEIKARRFDNWEISRLGALKDLPDINTALAEMVGETGPIADEASEGHVFAQWIDRW
jgi:ABC transporter substrate binding protein